MSNYTEEHVFWKLFIKLAAVLLSILILTIGACSAHIDYRIAKAVEDGSDPIVARAAFVSGEGMSERLIYISNMKPTSNQP